MVVLVRDGAELASWPLTQGDRLDLAVVDQLARWHLAARRLGYSIELRGACTQLVELLNLVGLSKLVAVPPTYGSRRAGRPKAANSAVSRKL